MNTPLPFGENPQETPIQQATPAVPPMMPPRMGAPMRKAKKSAPVGLMVLGGIAVVVLAFGGWVIASMGTPAPTSEVTVEV